MKKVILSSILSLAFISSSNAQEDEQVCLSQYGQHLFENTSLESLKGKCVFADQLGTKNFSKSEVVLKRFPELNKLALATSEQRKICQKAWAEEIAELQNAPDFSCLKIKGPAQSGDQAALLKHCSNDTFLSFKMVKPAGDSSCEGIQNLRRTMAVVYRMETMAFIENSETLNDLDTYSSDPRLVQALWYNAQHSDYNISYQKKTLHMLERLHATGHAPGVLVGRLRDDIAIHEEGVQYLGNNFKCSDGEAVLTPALADPENVDTRRARYGLPPLEQQRKIQMKKCS